MCVRGAAVALSTALAAVPVGTHAQQPDSTSIDAVFAEYDRADTPGCALGVVQDGSIVYQRGYGNANLDHGIPNAPHMVYDVGSVSKQFTAAAVALLADEGRVSLDDDVRRYIPELLDYAAGADRFGAGSNSIVHVRRDASGRVVGFTVDAGRVRSIGFERQP